MFILFDEITFYTVKSNLIKVMKSVISTGITSIVIDVAD